MEGWDLRVLDRQCAIARAPWTLILSAKALKYCGTFMSVKGGAICQSSLLEVWLSPDVFSFSGAISACEKAWAVKRSEALSPKSFEGLNLADGPPPPGRQRPVSCARQCDMRQCSDQCLCRSGSKFCESSPSARRIVV